MKKNVIIPNNIEKAIDYLIDFIKDENQEKLFSNNKEKFTTTLHPSLGRWIRNNWGFWTKEGDLYNYFISIGINHPDDMSSIIIDATWCKVNNEFFDLQKEITFYQNYWKTQGL